MKQPVVLLLTLMLASFLPAQSHLDWWMMSGGAGLHFKEKGKEMELVRSNMWGMLESLSVSDDKGNLLFYTDADSVMNRERKLLRYGRGFRGICSKIRAAPFHTQPHKYLLISQPLTEMVAINGAASCHSNGLCYSVLDMQADGGLGGIDSTQKEVKIHERFLIDFELIEKADKSGYWLFTVELPGNLVYLYSISEGKIDRKPMVIPLPCKTAMTARKVCDGMWGGNITFNPQQNRLVYSYFYVEEGEYHHERYVFEVNPATGAINYLYKFPTSSSFSKIVFSPDGRLLYAGETDHKQLVQYDFSFDNPAEILASRTVLTTFDGWTSMQLTPDGRILCYFDQLKMVYREDKPVEVNFHSIQYPNRKGRDCRFVKNVVSFKTNWVWFNFPHFSPFMLRFVPQDSLADIHLCEGEGFRRSPPVPCNDCGWQWVTPNGQTVTTDTFSLSAAQKTDGGLYRLFGIRKRDTLYEDAFWVDVQARRLDTLYRTFCRGTAFELPDGRRVRDAGYYTLQLPNTQCPQNQVLRLDYTRQGTLALYRYVTLVNDTSYQFPNGKIVAESGFHTDYIQSKEGCDSTVFTQVEAYPVRLRSIYFDYDTYHLRGDALAEVENWLAFLNRFPQARITLIGHTDTDGSEAYNDLLSHYRVMAVVKYLTDRGIKAERMRYAGKGERQAVYPKEQNPAQKQLNRRVEIRIEKEVLVKEIYQHQFLQGQEKNWER